MNSDPFINITAAEIERITTPVDQKYFSFFIQLYLIGEEKAKRRELTDWSKEKEWRTLFKDRGAQTYYRNYGKILHIRHTIYHIPMERLPYKKAAALVLLKIYKTDKKNFAAIWSMCETVDPRQR